jgi:hypothetical protein
MCDLMILPPNSLARQCNGARAFKAAICTRRQVADETRAIAASVSQSHQTWAQYERYHVVFAVVRCLHDRGQGQVKVVLLLKMLEPRGTKSIDRCHILYYSRTSVDEGLALAFERGVEALNLEAHACSWGTPAKADVMRAVKQFELSK